MLEKMEEEDIAITVNVAAQEIKGSLSPITSRSFGIKLPLQYHRAAALGSMNILEKEEELAELQGTVSIASAALVEKLHPPWAKSDFKSMYSKLR
jgi:hypothetical protein